MEEYKQTNRQLRKQLNNLNDEIDRIINIKSNKIGLKKLPTVDKNIEKTTDARMLQHEVDNLRKRLEQLHHDNEHVQERASVNHMERAKELEELLAAKRSCGVKQGRSGRPSRRRPIGWTSRARPSTPPTQSTRRTSCTIASNRSTRSLSGPANTSRTYGRNWSSRRRWRVGSGR